MDLLCRFYETIDRILHSNCLCKLYKICNLYTFSRFDNIVKISLVPRRSMRTVIMIVMVTDVDTLIFLIPMPV